MFQSFFEDQSKIKLPKSNNKLYDISTQEEVGYWNSAIEQIEALDS